MTVWAEPYRHSGRLGYAPIVMLVAGLVIAAVVGTAYAFVDVYTPIVGMVSVLITAAFSATAGFLVMHMVRLARCRNIAFARRVGFGIGVLVLYSSWAGFIYALVGRDTGLDDNSSLPWLWTHPLGIWDAANVIAQEGWRAYRGVPETGAKLWITWVCEAIFIVATVTLMAPLAVVDRVFCERCGRWSSNRDGMVRFAVPQDAAILAGLLHGDVERLFTTPVARSDTYPYMVVDATSCLGCNGTSTIRVSLVSDRSSPDGAPELQDTTNARWVVTPQQYHLLETFASRFKPEREGPNSPSAVGNGTRHLNQL